MSTITDNTESVKTITPPQYPLGKDESGHATWVILHNNAALYPLNPTVKEQIQMKDFILRLIKNFPCPIPCSVNAVSYLKTHEMEFKNALKTRQGLQHFLCELHNNANTHSGKKIRADCSVYLPKPQVEQKVLNDDMDKETIESQDTKINDPALRKSFNDFKRVSTKLFIALCRKHKLPVPQILFHACPDGKNSDTSCLMVLGENNEKSTEDVVFLHPKAFGLRTIVHEFGHYYKRKKNIPQEISLENEEIIEKEAQEIIDNEFPYDKITDKILTKIQQPVMIEKESQSVPVPVPVPVHADVFEDISKKGKKLYDDLFNFDETKKQRLIDKLNKRFVDTNKYDIIDNQFESQLPIDLTSPSPSPSPSPSNDEIEPVVVNQEETIQQPEESILEKIGNFFNGKPENNTSVNQGQPQQQQLGELETVVPHVARFPNASRIYNTYMSKRKVMADSFGGQSNAGNAGYEGYEGYEGYKERIYNNGEIEQQKQSSNIHSNDHDKSGFLSQIDNLFVPFGNMLKLSASDLNHAYTTQLLSNSVATLAESNLTHFGSLLTSIIPAIGLFALGVFGKNSMTYGDRKIVNQLSANLLMNCMRYANPKIRREVVYDIEDFVDFIVEGDIGGAAKSLVDSPFYDKIMHAINPDYQPPIDRDFNMSSFAADDVGGTSSFQKASSARRLQRAGLSPTGIGGSGIGKGAITVDGITYSPDIDPSTEDPMPLNASLRRDIRRVQRDPTRKFSGANEIQRLILAKRNAKESVASGQQNDSLFDSGSNSDAYKYNEDDNMLTGVSESTSRYDDGSIEILDSTDSGGSIYL